MLEPAGRIGQKRLDRGASANMQSVSSEIHAWKIRISARPLVLAGTLNYDELNDDT
jgi:hypothetical protein